MKLPVQGASEGVRDELRLPLSDGEVGHVPTGLSEVVTAFVRDGVLRPVVTLETNRTPYLLYDEDGWRSRSSSTTQCQCSTVARSSPLPRDRGGGHRRRCGPLRSG